MYLIEEAQHRDLTGIITLAEATLTERYAPQFFDSMLQLAGDTFLVARDLRDPQPCGFALATRQNLTEGRLLVITLRDDTRRRGLGARLLREIEKRMRRRGALELTLEVREDNTSAITFYRRHGFELIGRMPRYYQDGSQALLMRKAL